MIVYDTCLSCEKQISRQHWLAQRKYCNIHCQRAWHYLNITKPQIERGEVRERQTLRRYMIRERGHQCEMCQNTEWLGEPIPLECDHIDGDASNNMPINLRIICPNCHAMTPTWKAEKPVV